MKPTVMLADANVFLRFLRNDHVEHSPAAKQVLEQSRQGDVGQGRAQHRDEQAGKRQNPQQ